MKTLRNDTKYIIKKVIIGVLIAIILFNARKCGVYAETKDIYVIAYVNSDSVGLTTLSTNVGNRVNFCNTTINDINFHFYTESNNANNYNDCYVFLFQNPSNINEYSFQFVPFDRGNLIFSAITPNTFLSFEGTYTSTNTSGVFSTPPNYYLNNLDTNFGVTSKSNIYNQNYPHLSTYSGYAIFNINNVTNSYQNFSVRNSNSTRWKSEYYDIITTWSLYSNSEVPIKIYDEVKFDPTPPFPPSGYLELSLKDYQGVVFVPKNYDNINCELTSSGLCETFFNYYYQEEIKESYFPLDNHFKTTLNSDILNSPDEPTGRVSEFPIYQLDEEENKIYNAFLIYNFTNDGTPLDPNNYYAYGSAKIWYDSTLWNYYLVEDFNTWTENICYYVGSTETCIDVSALPTLREAIEEADQQALIESFSPTSSNVILEFLKLPFTFLMGLTPDKCTSFDLPIPHIGTTRIYCLSDTFHEVMGDYYNIVAIIFNGFLLYTFTLMNIRTFKECSDADDDKLEVVEL